jgi:hypothetical protein
MSLDLINADFLRKIDIKEIATICCFSPVSNDYIDYCADNCSSEFRFTSPVRKEFLSTLNADDKEFFIDLILSNDKTIKKAYEWIFDCDEVECLEVA